MWMQSEPTRDLNLDLSLDLSLVLSLALTLVLVLVLVLVLTLTLVSALKTHPALAQVLVPQPKELALTALLALPHAPGH